MKREELYKICKDWMEKQDKLELFRDYDDYFQDDTVRKLLDYVEGCIEEWTYLDPETYIYDFISDQDWFNSYEQESFDEKFMNPFIEEHPELEDEEDLSSALREAMYDCDKFDADIEHFNRITYNFYLLTDPEKTIWIPDYPYDKLKTHLKYFRSLKKSQWWTERSTHMREIYDWAWWELWICIHYNWNLHDMIEFMKAKRLTVKEWSSVYLFNPYQWAWWVETELTSDWTFNLDLKEIWLGVDGARKGPRGYTPEEVYWWVHSYFDKNWLTFKSQKK